MRGRESRCESGSGSGIHCFQLSPQRLIFFGFCNLSLPLPFCILEFEACSSKCPYSGNEIGYCAVVTAIVTMNTPMVSCQVMTTE